MLATHDWLDEHVPQTSVPPQPLGIVPQSSPAGHVARGVHPQTFGVPPPPQVCPVGHDMPQLSVPPQPFEIAPQLSGTGQLVMGVHVLMHVLPVHVSPVGHVPHASVVQP